MDGFIQLFSEYDVPAAFLVNIELTLWSALFSLILGVVLVMSASRRYPRCAPSPELTWNCSRTCR